RRLCNYFAVATTEAFGALTRLELNAAAACVTYVERTQLGKRPPLSPPSREAAGATLSIDQATRANLKLVRTLSGERRGSLLAAKPAEIADAIAALRQADPALTRELAAALADELPLLKRDGGFVRAGYEASLDESRALRDESRKVIAQLQSRYADDTGVRSLK